MADVFRIVLDDASVIQHLQDSRGRVKAALRRGVAAVFRVIRNEAMAQLPEVAHAGGLTHALERASGYTQSITASDAAVHGRFGAKPAAAVFLQVPVRGHVAPMAGLREWLEAIGLKALLTSGGKRTPERERVAIFIKQQPGRPFVAPAAATKEAEAVAAFNQVVLDALE